MKICNKNKCNQKVSAKGYCEKHYRRFKKTGSTEKPKFIQKKCYSDECTRDSKAKGLCDMHYRRLKSTGKIDTPIKIKPKCKIEGCEKPYIAKELCQTHYEMIRQNMIIDKKAESMIKNHNGLCDICNSGVPGFGRKNLSIDHDHKTGSVRGLLCQKCNIGLGNFNDSPDLLKKAINYLKNSSAML